MKNAEHALYDANLNADSIVQEFTHNIATRLKVSPDSFKRKKVYTCVIVEDDGKSFNSIVGMTWSLDTDNTPIITVQLSQTSKPITCKVVVYTRR
jgi:hypothetical protein